MEKQFEGRLATRVLVDYSVGDLLRAAKYQLQNSNVRRTRESSLAQTKIDEALLWLSQCGFIAEDD